MAQSSITWFPGHMRQAMTALKRVVKGVDLVLEVRDARVRQSVCQQQHPAAAAAAASGLVPSTQSSGLTHAVQPCASHPLTAAMHALQPQPPPPTRCRCRLRTQS